MTDTKVFITRKMAQEAIDMLIAEGYQVEVWEDELPPSREVMLEKAKECDAEGFQTNTEFAVPAGSLVRGWTVPSMKKSPGFFNRRTRYTADGVIMVSSDDRLRFVADHELSHSRQAEINSMASLQVFSTV